jgi:hypothetical protein
MEVGNRQQLRLTRREPIRGRRRLALRAMTVAAGNGRRPLLALNDRQTVCLWRCQPDDGAWRGSRRMESDRRAPVFSGTHTTKLGSLKSMGLLR